MSSGFITEAELAERRRARQEEWEKVRKPDQPTEAPEEEYDHRSLFERLQAQKQKRDLEYEEAHRLKNMIKGLDDDEVEFLDLVDRSKLEEERKKSLEEAREMAEFRSKVACLQEESLADRIQQEIRKPTQNNSRNNANSCRSSQSKLLAGAVVKKRSTDAPSGNGPPPKRLKESNEHEESPDSTEDKSLTDVNSAPETSQDNKVNKEAIISKFSNRIKVGGMTCIGVLPGLGHYRTESSDEVDSDESTDIEDTNSVAVVGPKFDLVGRKIVKKAANTE